jgi:hypothetical protein
MLRIYLAVTGSQLIEPNQSGRFDIVVRKGSFISFFWFKVTALRLGLPLFLRQVFIGDFFFENMSHYDNCISLRLIISAKLSPF